MSRLVLGATVGNCIHVAGLLSFLRLAEEEGYEARFLGARLSPKDFAAEVLRQKPALAAVSYRLTPEVARTLFAELAAELCGGAPGGTRLLFGGTPPVAEEARKAGIFIQVYSGGEGTEAIRAFLRGSAGEQAQQIPAQTLVERIREREPHPLLRHHYGRPTMEETVAGAREIALAGVLDVLSLGPDQNAQEHFFHPEEMDRAQDGAGGVPLRRPEDLEAIYQASRCGNHPLVRCYSGTRDLLRWAEMSVKTIRIAWGAIPLCWYNRMDGRSRRTLPEAIREHQETIRWYAAHGVPVEVNESHQWSLRDAHDALAVTMAFLAAYNAKRLGVRHYVSQYMFNTPRDTSPTMDVAKMLAKQELIGGLEDDGFTVFRQVRAGLASLSPRANLAKGQMAASAIISLAMKPHILHVVGFSEGDHAVTAAELIESCEIARGAVKCALSGFPDLSADADVQRRKAELLAEADSLLNAIRALGPRSPDPWSDPGVLTAAVEQGLLDAPGLCGSPHARGQVMTALVDGACRAVDPGTGRALTESERLQRLSCAG